MTNLSLADAGAHIDATRRTYHHYNHSGSHGLYRMSTTDNS